MCHRHFDTDRLPGLLTLIHREEAERVSELKNISASNNLPYGTLVLGSEGIKDAIQNFDDAYVTCYSTFAFYLCFIAGGNPISRTSACHPTSSTRRMQRRSFPTNWQRAKYRRHKRSNRQDSSPRRDRLHRAARRRPQRRPFPVRPSDADTAVNRVWVPPQPARVLAGGVSRTRRVCLETSWKGRSPRGRITSSRRSRIRLQAPHASGLGRLAPWLTWQRNRSSRVDWKKLCSKGHSKDVCITGMFFTLPINDLASAVPYPRFPKRESLFLAICVTILHYASPGAILGL